MVRPGTMTLEWLELKPVPTKVGCECVFGALTPCIAWPMQRMTRHNGLAQVPKPEK